MAYANPLAPGVSDELKIVVFNRTDIDWAISHQDSVAENCLLYLQPEWSKREKITPEIINYVMQNPKWKISLQTHKYLHIP